MRAAQRTRSVRVFNLALKGIRVYGGPEKGIIYGKGRDMFNIYQQQQTSISLR